MIGLGTILNTAAVAVGGLLGLCLKNGFKKEIQDILMQACGVANIFIAVSGALSYMLVVTESGIETQGTMLLIFSLVIGSVVGELLKLEDKLDGVGERIKAAVKRNNDSQFVEGFVNVSLIFCIGAMAIVGSIQDGMNHDYSILVAKSIMDGIIVMVFASTYGLGAVFSAIPIFIYQGSITLLAAFCGSFISQVLIDEVSFVGSALIFCVGINIAFGKRFRIGNMLPAMLIPVVYEIVKGFLR